MSTLAPLTQEGLTPGTGGWSGFTVGVPEPTTVALIGLGLFGLGFSRRKKA